MITIDAIFKVINFLIMGFIFVALFKKYIVPFFMEGKKKYDTEIQDKKHSRYLLKEQLHQLAVDNKEQLIQGKDLEYKCHQWTLKMQQNHEQQEKARHKILSNMVEHRQKQWVFIQQQRCLQQKLPVIFAEVETYCKESQDREKMSKESCDALLTFMKE